MSDPLAEKMRLADRVTSSGDYYADMARVAREHAAGVVEDLWHDQCAGNRNEQACDYCRAYAQVIRAFGGTDG